MTAYRRIVWMAVVVVSLLLLTGCQFTGINDIPLPVGKGHGADAMHITVELADAANLVPNSEVRYDEVVVGSVRSIRFENWKAELTVGIDPHAQVPNNVVAKIAQKSLLGAEYLELSTSGRRSRILLSDGATLGINRTGRYPETEEVLSAAALLLNNGGFPQLHTIAHELNEAVTGHTGDVRSLVREISTFSISLSSQRSQIADDLTALDHLSRTVARQRSAIGRALERLPLGIRALTTERHQFTTTLVALKRFSQIGHRVISANQGGLSVNLRNLRPVTAQLAAHAGQLVQTIDSISWPFPIKSINRSFFGDYINFFATLNIDIGQTALYWTHGSSLESLVATLVGVPAASTGTGNPLSAASGSSATGSAGRALGSRHAAQPSGRGASTDSTGRALTDPVPPTSLLDGLLGGLLGGHR